MFSFSGSANTLLHLTWRRSSATRRIKLEAFEVLSVPKRENERRSGAARSVHPVKRRGCRRYRNKEKTHVCKVIRCHGREQDEARACRERALQAELKKEWDRSWDGKTGVKKRSLWKAGTSSRTIEGGVRHHSGDPNRCETGFRTEVHEGLCSSREHDQRSHIRR